MYIAEYGCFTVTSMGWWKDTNIVTAYTTPTAEINEIAQNEDNSIEVLS
jgi:hypothetical protein